MPKFNVFGMCNPIFDLQAEVSDELLATLPYDKGGMFLVSQDKQRELIPIVYEHIVNAAPGGSGANTLIGVAQLGATACYTGRIAQDEHGELYRQGLREQNVHDNLGIGDGMTGLCVVLITPDAQRTMITCLGSCQLLSPSDVRVSDLRESEFLYVTGYLWDTDSQKEAVLYAMNEANKAGIKVALSLSDPFCVRRHREDFINILRHHVDIVIGNFEEAKLLVDADTPEAAARALSEFSDIVAVTLDANGSILRTCNEEHRIPAFPVKAVDTTGAGDTFAAGLLYGLTHRLSLETTGRLASYMAAQVVAKLGPRIDELDEKAVMNIISGRIHA